MKEDGLDGTCWPVGREQKCLQANYRTLQPLNRSDTISASLPLHYCTLFPIHYALNMEPFDAILSGILAAC
jgi:hypothetical protein